MAPLSMVNKFAAKFRARGMNPLKARKEAEGKTARITNWQKTQRKLKLKRKK